MPQELLGAVLRTGDAAGRSRRRWLFPVSLAAHAVAGAAIIVIPLTAEVEMPTPASPFVDRWVRAEMRPLPPIPQPTASTGPVSRSTAPTSPPDSMPSKDEPTTVAAGDPVPGAVPGIPGVPGGVTSVAQPLDPLPPPEPPPPPPPRKPVPVGGAIKPPQRIVDVPPVYPAAAVAARIEGIVILEAVIDETGRVDRVRVLRSVPFLDAPAMDAVRSWRYTPTLLNGLPVPVLMTVTVRFSLQR